MRILSSFSIDDRDDAVDGNLKLGQLAAYMERGYSGISKVSDGAQRL